MKLCHIVGWFTGKRIIEHRGKFIAQYRLGILEKWMGISRNANERWIPIDRQLEMCSFDTIEEARAIFEPYLKQRRAKELAEIEAYRITVHCV